MTEAEIKYNERKAKILSILAKGDRPMSASDVHDRSPKLLVSVPKTGAILHRLVYQEETVDLIKTHHGNGGTKYRKKILNLKFEVPCLGFPVQTPLDPTISGMVY